MQMIDRLSSIFAIVDHNTVSIVQVQLSGDLFTDNQQMSEQRFIFFGRLRQLRNRLLWNDQEMCRRLSTDIVEGNTLTKR